MEKMLICSDLNGGWRLMGRESRRPMISSSPQGGGNIWESSLHFLNWKMWRYGYPSLCHLQCWILQLFRHFDFQLVDLTRPWKLFNAAFSSIRACLFEWQGTRKNPWGDCGSLSWERFLCEVSLIGVLQGWSHSIFLLRSVWTETHVVKSVEATI